MLKRKLGEAYIKYKLRVARGSSFTSEIEGLLSALQKGGIIVLLINTYTGYLVPLWILPVLWFIQKSVEFFLGWFDEKYLHWWQFENNYNSRNLNPWNQEVLGKISDIQKKLTKR